MVMGRQKRLENAMAEIGSISMHNFEQIASRVSGKNVQQILEEIDKLNHDVELIMSSEIEFPDCWDSEIESKNVGTDIKGFKRSKWTQEEHQLFLHGIGAIGVGDWKTNSQNYVTSRTPNQIASHAQKFLLPKKVRKDERRRKSINDNDTIGEKPINIRPSIRAPQRKSNSSIVTAPR